MENCSLNLSLIKIQVIHVALKAKFGWMDGWMDGRMDRGVWLIHLKMIKTSYIPQMSSDTCYNSSDTNVKHSL